jgi:hypothetical protein
MEVLCEIRGDLVICLQTVLGAEFGFEEMDRLNMWNNLLQLLHWLTQNTAIFASEPFVTELPRLLIESLEVFGATFRSRVFGIIHNVFHDAGKTPDVLPFLINTFAQPLITSIRDPSDVSPLFVCLRGLIQSAGSLGPRLRELHESFTAIVHQLIDLPIAKNMRNDGNLCEIFNVLLDVYPPIYCVVLESRFFPQIFNYINLDSQTFYPFRLLQRILRESPKRNPPDIFSLINWEALKAFISISDGREVERVEMLRFCQAYLEFGNPVIEYFVKNGLFEDIVSVYPKMMYAERFNALQVLVTAIELGSNDQLVSLFDMGVLELLLEGIEGNDDCVAVELDLKAVERMWLACQDERMNNFLGVFRENGGYRMLLDIEVCQTEADYLSDLLEV